MTTLIITNFKMMKPLVVSTEYSAIQLCRTFEKCSKNDLEFLIKNLSNECIEMMAGVYIFTRMAIEDLSVHSPLQPQGSKRKRIRKCLSGKKSKYFCTSHNPICMKRSILLRQLETGILPMIISTALPMITRVTTRGRVGIDLYADCRYPTFLYNYLEYLKNAVKMI